MNFPGPVALRAAGPAALRGPMRARTPPALARRGADHPDPNPPVTAGLGVETLELVIVLLIAFEIGLALLRR